MRRGAAPSAAPAFVQREPRDGEPSSETTEFAVAFTPSTLYVAVWALDSDPGAIIAKQMEKDADLSQDDSILIVLDTFLDGRNSYGFSTNANGARTDTLVTDEGRDVNRNWDGVWAVGARRTDWGWSAEIAIPFSTLRFDRSLDTWGLNVERRIRRKNEETFWAPMARETGSFNSSAAYRVSLAGQLHGLTGIKPSRSLDVKPYVLGSGSEGAAGLGGGSGGGGASGPGMRGSSTDSDAGLDLKWGVTRSLALDLTYNTDFAEVEVDDLRVNLTRFSLFFPEKRQFFLENAGIFDFGPAQRVPWEPALLKAFFSRRIGLDGGLTVPIDGGGRLTGRAGGWNLGVLALQTDEVDEQGRFVPTTGFGVARVKRNVGQRSSVGAIFTLRDEDAAGAADAGTASDEEQRSLYGVDFEYKPTQRWKANGYWSRTRRRRRREDDGETASYSLGLEYRGPTLVTSYDLVEAEENYDPAVGFLLRDDFHLDAPRLLWLPRIERAGIRNWYFEAEGARYERSSDGRLESERIELTPIGATFESGDFFFINRILAKEQLFAPFPIFPGVVIPTGLYDYEQSSIDVETSTGRPVSGTAFAQWGGFYSGDAAFFSADLNLRPSRRLRTATSWDRSDVELPEGDFIIDLYSQRFDVSFTTNLRVNVIAQYNEASGDLGVNARFHWIYKPGADLFIVYNENWIAPDLSDRRTLGRQLIVKVNYLWQR